MEIGDVLIVVGRRATRDAAIEFTRAALPIFPCEPGGKRPLTRSGFLDASCDPDRIQAWWQRWPEANIGMPTGPASGVDVVDVDVKSDGTGFPMFRGAVLEGLLDGDLARVRTPSGGMHVYFLALPEVPQRCWQAARAHIDFRGAGGYVIVPPSVALGESGVAAYRPLSVSSTRPKPLDAAALRDFVDPQPSMPARTWSGGAPHNQSLSDWVSRLREGERNHGLFWASCRLSEAGVIGSVIVEILGPAAEKVGLSPEEVRRTVQSACRHTSSSHGSTSGPPGSNGPQRSSTAPGIRGLP